MPSPRTLSQRAALAAFLARLPSLALSATGCRNVAARFGLTDEQLAAALATARQQRGGQP
jgi:hypothetical protein